MEPCSVCGLFHEHGKCPEQHESSKPDVPALASRLIGNKSTGGWTRNSLRHAIDDLQNRAKRCRKNYTHQVMVGGAEYLARAYEDAADVLKRALNAISSDG